MTDTLCRTKRTAELLANMIGIEVDASEGTTDGALLGIEFGTTDSTADDGAMFGMELGADDGTSDSALHGHATVVVLLVSANGADASTDGSATDGMLLGIEPGIVDNTAACTMLGNEVEMIHCLISSLVQQMVV